MFSFDLQEDGSYKVHLPDNTFLHFGKGVEDTKELRQELAKLSHRIAHREYIDTSRAYKELMLGKKQQDIMKLTPEEIDTLLEEFQLVDHEDDIYSSTPVEDKPELQTINNLVREKLIEKEILILCKELLEAQNEKSRKA